MKAIGYVRRSTDKQDESLTQQRERLSTFARQHGWSLVEIYSDDAVSGSELSRPGLEKLIAAASGSDVDIVLIWDRNRLARPKDAIDGMLLERRLMAKGTRVVYASNGKVADQSFGSGLLSYVEHHQNGDYLRKLSRDTSRGLISLVKRGLWPGGPIPFGYDRLIIDGDTPKRIVRSTTDGGQVVLDATSGDVLDTLPRGKSHKKQDHESCALIPSTPERVRAVRCLFEGYAAGKPTRTLRDELNDSGFRTSRGSYFTVQTLLPMLENPAYIGRAVYNRRTHSKWHRVVGEVSVERTDEGFERRDEEDWIVCEDAWEPLVDTDTFKAVQARRTKNKDRNNHHRGNAFKSNYLLTGLAYCTICGGKLTGTTQTSGKGYKTRYYTCSRYSAGYKNECPKRYTVPADKVEKYILEIIRTDLMNLRDDDSFFDMILEEFGRLTRGRSDALQQLQRRHSELENELASVRDHIVSMDAHTARSVGLYERADALVAERETIQSRLIEEPAGTIQFPGAGEIRRLAENLFDQMETVFDGGGIEEKRGLMAEYVNRIDAEPARNTVRISLYPTGLSQMVAGAGFEPATFGL
jgi:site-specific DNA recombinase